MTGPEYFQLAEDVRRQATRAPYLDITERHLYLIHAQVLATMALTAATAEQPAELGPAAPQRRAWDAVLTRQADGCAEFECEICGAALVTLPGAEVPDPPLCTGCRNGKAGMPR